MKFKISTLLWAVVCVAISIGWLAERRYYQSGLEKRVEYLHAHEKTIGSAEGVNKFAHLLARHEAGVTTEEGFARGRARYLLENVFSLHFNELVLKPKPSPVFDNINSDVTQQNRILDTAGHSLYLLGVHNSSELDGVFKDDPSLFSSWTSPDRTDGSFDPAFLDFVDKSITQYLEEHGSQAEKFSRRMRPAIKAVEQFIRENGRCPSFRESNELFDGMHGISLRSGTEHVKELGGTKPNDYVLACWVGEWDHCYRSWDKVFYTEHPNGKIFEAAPTPY